jgi:phosphatidylglycerophosphatase A
MVARPSLRFALSHPAHFLALGFGVGLAPSAPGTFGTLLALPVFWWLEPRLQPLDFLILLGAMYVAGVWICDKTGRDLGIEDHKAIVWDEIVAFLAVLFFVPEDLFSIACAFLLFRVFDVVKPPPIRAVDAALKNGFGVMLDDLLAAGYTLLVLALARRVFG